MEAAYGGKPTWFPFVESFWSAKRGSLEVARIVELSGGRGLCPRPFLWTALISGFQRDGVMRSFQVTTVCLWWWGGDRETAILHPLRHLPPSFNVTLFSSIPWWLHFTFMSIISIMNREVSSYYQSKNLTQWCFTNWKTNVTKQHLKTTT